MTQRVIFSAPLPISVTPVTIQAGGNFSQFPDLKAIAIDLINTSSSDIEYSRVEFDIYIPIPAGGNRMITGIKNANEISIRRIDQGNSVTIYAEVFE
jgi:hypothetical protein